MFTRFALLVAFAIASAWPQTFSPAQRRADLDWVRTELPRRHPNLFSVTPRAAFDRSAAALADQTETLSDAQFYTQLISLVASARDAHTSIVPNQPAVFPQLPLLLRWFDDGIFVTAAVDTSLNAAQLLAVNDLPVAEAVERLRPLVSYENEYWFRARLPGYLGNLGVLRGAGLVPEAEPARLTFRLAGGDIVTQSLLPGPGDLVRPIAQTPGFTPATLRRLTENYWAEYWPNTRTLYIAYRVCAEMPDKTIPQFVSEISGLSEQGPLDNIVIDLRGNTGGNSVFFERLLTGLADRLARLAFDPNLRSYGFIDGGTFSSGMIAAFVLRQNLGSRTPLYGEPTGGSPTGYGEVLSFRLPGSNLPGQHSTRFFNFGNGSLTIAPDVAIGLRSTDYFARHDPKLAHAFARSLPASANASGDIIVWNAASLRPDAALAPNGLATAFANFGAGPPQLLLNGAAVATFGATPAQASFVVPATLTTGTVTIEAGSQQGQFRLRSAAPALFSAEPGNPFQPAAHTRSGDTLRLYATGLTGPNVAVWIAEKPASVTGATPAPGVPGLWLVETKVPENVSGFVPVFLAAEGLASNAVTLQLLP